MGTDSNGLVFSSSLGIPGVAVFGDSEGYGKVPYSENFNLAVQFSVARSTTVEIAYVGNRGVLNAVRLPARAGVTTGGALPNDFFHVQLPQGFATTNPLAFNIRTLEGFKLFRIRNNYDTNFGTLNALNNPRYIQFGIGLFF